MSVDHAEKKLDIAGSPTSFLYGSYLKMLPEKYLQDPTGT